MAEESSSERVVDFFAFPSSSCDAMCTEVGFRTRVQLFLRTQAMIPSTWSPLIPDLVSWEIPMSVAGIDDCFHLNILEEDVSKSRWIYCEMCRIFGWGEHPICSKRYHFIIRFDGGSIGCHMRRCLNCGGRSYLLQPECNFCKQVTSLEDDEDFLYGEIMRNDHLLHGVVHANGYGHLLRINGREGGSKNLSGRDLMNFWERLCTVLGVRKATVVDLSKKYGLEQRLLNTVIEGHSWYGNWGYQFGIGSYGIRLEEYESTVSYISSLPLSMCISHSHHERASLHGTIMFYQSLSERNLRSIRDLFSFLVSLIKDAQEKMDKDTFEEHLAFWSKGWSRDEIEQVESTILKVLKTATKSKWVNIRCIRGVACHVASKELVDHCIHKLQGEIVDSGKVITSRINPHSGMCEYRLEAGTESVSENAASSVSSIVKVEHILEDLKYLYQSFLHPETMHVAMPIATKDLMEKATQKLLDCKLFVKDFKSEQLSTTLGPSKVHLWCKLELVHQFNGHATYPPEELVILSSDATVFDLKIEATKAFRAIYCYFQDLTIEKIIDYEEVYDFTPVKSLLGSNSHVRVLGYLHWNNDIDKFRTQRGPEEWIVDCICKAQMEDGERMIACDHCNTWMHTRCIGIPDSGSYVPETFVCSRCATK